MRKFLFALAAVAAVGFALPAATNTADAATVIIKKSNHGYNHGYRHRNRVVVRDGWRHRHHRAHRAHRGATIVVR